LILEEVLRPFDLSTGPLMRARLLRLAKLPSDEHLLLLSLHHIVSDGWSMGVLVREVAMLYEAYAVGAESPLKELNLQYGDYAVWQREWLRGEVLDQQLAYWRKQLAGAPPVLELPADRPRPQVQTFRGAALPFKLSKELAEELRALSRREGVTLYMTLLAGLQTLLARYTGQDDISTGTPIANRRRGELENLIGFFVNTLVLRTDLSRNPTFHELVQRVKETALGAYAHQDVPFEMLVEVLQPERSMSYTPLFQVLFVLQNAPQEKLELSGLTVELLDIDSGTAKFDLMLSLEESENGLEGVCEYSTDLFDEATIRRLLKHFETLLEGAVNNPDEHVAHLPLLPQAERRQLLDEWNATAEQYPSDLCVHELFAQQAEQTPSDVAVIFDETQLSYRELNERANKLADRLRTFGVGPEQVVGVMLERSVEMIVGILATLKAGGAYMPLDPSYPPERLRFMIEDAKPAVILTAEGPSATDYTDQSHGSDPDPRNPCYVIYTSGSTGRPKAVVMPHRAAVNLINYQIQSSGHEGRLRTLQFASLSFDVSFQEIFSTLCAGGSLVLLREEERRDAGELLRVITEQRVERLFLPFVALQHLAEEADREEHVPSSLRQVITAGEQLKITPHVARLFQRLNGCTLDNHYGPTETHLATMWRGRLGQVASDW
jgi:non-ribosomal peptide synthetase component F